MPLVKFITNLGSRDGAALGLDYTECSKDAVVEVTQAQADKLIGLAAVLADKGEKATPKVAEHAPKAAPPEHEPKKGH